MVTTTTSFAEQRDFAAQVAKEKASVDWAIRQDSEGRREPSTKRRVRQRRTRDGQKLFAVTFFDGNRPKRTDWLAQDAKKEAEFGVEKPKKGSVPRSLGQLKGLSKSNSEPCFGSKRDRRKKGPKPPFQVTFPLPSKGIDLRRGTARDQACFFQPRVETVALSATEKWGLRKWGLDVDAITWPDGTQPPPWVTAVGNTTNKWANREMPIRAAREEQEFAEHMLGSSASSRALHMSERVQPTATLPPWVKELPPVRDGRKQLASGKIIPFLDQHVYPEGGVAEVKRARRREKDAFLQTVTGPSRMALGEKASDVAGNCGLGPRHRNPGIVTEKEYAARNHEAHRVVDEESVREKGSKDKATAVRWIDNGPDDFRDGGTMEAKTAAAAGVAVVKAGMTVTSGGVVDSRLQSVCLVKGRPVAGYNNVVAFNGVAVAGNLQQRQRRERQGAGDTRFSDHEEREAAGERQRGAAGSSDAVENIFSSDCVATGGKGDNEAQMWKGGREKPGALAGEQRNQNRASPVVTASVSVVDIGAIQPEVSPA